MSIFCCHLVLYFSSLSQVKLNCRFLYLLLFATEWIIPQCMPYYAAVHRPHCASLSSVCPSVMSVCDCCVQRAWTENVRVVHFVTPFLKFDRLGHEIFKNQRLQIDTVPSRSNMCDTETICQTPLIALFKCNATFSTFLSSGNLFSKFYLTFWGQFKSYRKMPLFALYFKTVFRYFIYTSN